MSADWRGVRVAITGHTGFKGAWLAYMLQRLGADVYGYALAPETSPNLFDVLRLRDCITSVVGDVRDGTALSSFFGAAKPGIVFHFAAQSLVRTSYDIPRETFDVNVLGTISCLEVALAHGVELVVAATSDKCYRNDGLLQRPFVESDPLGGEDPYSASKGAAEIAIESYRTSFFRPRGLQLASVRAGNVIGGGDWSPERLLTDLARAAFEGAPLAVRSPRSVRPWQHVLDALRGYLAIAEAGVGGQRVDEAWNVGPAANDSLAVSAVVEEFGRATGKSLTVGNGSEAGKPEANVLRLDAAKIGARLGWQPRLATVEAIELTADWYAKYYAGEDMRRASDAQIEKICSFPI